MILSTFIQSHLRFTKLKKFLFISTSVNSLSNSRYNEICSLRALCNLTNQIHQKSLQKILAKDYNEFEAQDNNFAISRA